MEKEFWVFAITAMFNEFNALEPQVGVIKMRKKDTCQAIKTLSFVNPGKFSLKKNLPGIHEMQIVS